MWRGFRDRLAHFGKASPQIRNLSTSPVAMKSESSQRLEQFPYQHLKHRDASHMSAEMESTARLPLRSFFAQHRPLMPYSKPGAGHDGPTMEEADCTRWVHVQTTNGRHPLFTPGEGPLWNIVPECVAKQLGPFNKEALIKAKTLGFRRRPEVPLDLRSNFEPEVLSTIEMQSVLSKKFPILMQHLQKLAGTNGEVKVIPLSVERLGGIPDEELMEATSVRRKRKLKMNRHKYRKRLKEQRTKRRRLGK